MPGMKGLEFCEKIENPYIRKQDPNTPSIFRDFILQSQLKYFKALTEVSFEALIKKDIVFEDHRNSQVYDPSFSIYFNRLIEMNNITEYYFN